MQAVEATALELWQTLEAEVYRFPSATAIFSGLESPYFNKIVVSSQLSQEEFQEILRVARSKNLPYSWIVPTHITLEGLKKHHFSPSVHMTCMVMNLEKRFLEVESQIRVDEVVSVAELKTNVEIWKESFQVADAAYTMQFERLKSHFMKKDRALVFFLGFLEEKPIACGWLLLGKTYAGIYNIGTKLGYRNRGAATMMMYRLVLEARRRGYQHVVLTALPEAKGIYEKLGFESMREQVLYLKNVK